MDKNLEAMTEALRCGNRIIEAKLVQEQGWTEDEIMDILEDIAEKRFVEMQNAGECLSVEQLDNFAGGDDYFANSKR